MVSNNVNNLKNTVAMQAGIQPPMQGVDADKLKQSVDNSYLSNRMKASSGDESNPLATAATGAALWYGIAQGMDKFNKECAGDFDKSLFGKVAGWGDRMSDKAGKTTVGAKLNGVLRKVTDSWNKLTGKSKIAYTLANHSTAPEWSFAKNSAKGLEGFLAGDTAQVFEEFLKPISDYHRKLMFIPMGRVNQFQKLEQYGVDRKYIDKFVQGLKGLSFDEKALALQKEELKLLGVSDDMIKQLCDKKGLQGLQKLAYNLKVRKLGFKSTADYKAIEHSIIDNPEKVMEALKRADKNIKVSIWRKNGFFGKITSHFFGRQVSPSEYYNKYLVATGKGGRTRFGRGLTKALGYLTEGCTNRYAGGKLAVAIQAGIFADMLVHTFKAPKGEKGKTLAERFVNDFTYFMALPLGVMGLHKVGGFKYAGLDNKGREAYRKALKVFNDKVDAGLLSDKDAYKKASKELDKLLGAQNIKNPITKLLHKIGKLINKGNEGKHCYVSKAKMNLNWGRKLLNGNIIGVPMRLLIPLMVVSPFLAKIATKTCHSIFGKPSKSVLDEDKEEKPQQELTPEQQAQLQKMVEEYKKQQEAEAARIAAKRAEPLVSNNSPTNLLTMYKNGQAYKNTIPPVGGAGAANLQKQSQEPVRTYIPSPEPVVIQGADPDLTPAEAALRKADMMEQRVAETLSMRR